MLAAFTKETKSLSFALASGGAEAESVSLADEVERNGEDATAQTYAQALSDGQSAAVALSFAKASQAGGKEAKAASKVIIVVFCILYCHSWFSLWIPDASG